jgi:small-conductance mechanosensitive channel
MIESSTLVDSLRRTGQAILAMLPDLLLALVLLIAGWLIAKLMRRLAIRLLRSLRIDELAERAGFEDFLIQGGVQVTTVTLIGNTIYWLILAGVFIALLDALGMRSAGALLERMMTSCPT